MRVNGNCKWLVIALILAFVSVFFAGCNTGDASGVTPDPKNARSSYRTVTDSRGVEVQVSAEEIVDTISSRVAFIRDRTKDIPPDEQKQVLYFGAPTWAKDKGGAGYAFGSGTTEVGMMEDVVNVRSAYTEPGRNLLSAEQLLAIDPEVIILCTWSGYHPPRQLTEDGHYSTIQSLRAIQEGEVYSLAATPCKSERLEFPINMMVMAKAVYPDRFADVNLVSWIREFIVELYDTDEATTDQIVDALMLEYL